MKIDVSREELAMLMQHRKEQYDKNRPDHSYSSECQHLNFDADGDFCEIGKGRGVNSHCWARIGKECPFYKKNS